MKTLALSTVVALSISACAAQAGDWAVEGFGGVRLSKDLTYGFSTFALDSGSIWGARALYGGMMPDVSVGLEFSATEAHYTGFPSSSRSKALMAIARYTFPTTGPVGVYAGIGLGSIQVEYDGSTAFPAFSGDDTQFGGQISLGAQYMISDSFGVFGEIIHQRAFSDSTIAGVGNISYQSNNVVMGARLEF